MTPGHSETQASLEDQVNMGPPPHYHRSDCNICRKQDGLATPESFGSSSDVKPPVSPGAGIGGLSQAAGKLSARRDTELAKRLA
jgi:hypothetical protein